MKKSLILCEGYHDRDFLAGWFEHVHQWKDSRNERAAPVTFGGESTDRTPYFLFDSPASDHRIGILPVGGRRKLAQEFTRRLDGLQLGPLPFQQIVVVGDVDLPASVNPQAVIDLVRTAIVSAGQSSPVGDPRWQVAGLEVEVVSMHAGPVNAAGIDTKERLERVVAVAFAAAFPDRHESMRSWLDNRPAAANCDSGMALHWAAMAGWFPDQGCTDYLRRAIWQDDAMCAALRTALEPTGLLRVTEYLMRG